MSDINKTNDVLIVDTFKNVFQRRSSEVFKPDVPEFQTMSWHWNAWSCHRHWVSEVGGGHWNYVVVRLQ